MSNSGVLIARATAHWSPSCGLTSRCTMPCFSEVTCVPDSSGRVAALLCVLSLFSADSASAQQTLNFSLGAFHGSRRRRARRRRRAGREPRPVPVRFQRFQQRVTERRMAGAARRLLRSRRRDRLRQRGVDTIYDEFVRPDGSEIEQELKLRIDADHGDGSDPAAWPASRRAAVHRRRDRRLPTGATAKPATSSISPCRAGRFFARAMWRPARRRSGGGVRRAGSARQRHLRRRSAVPESGRRSGRERFPRAENRPRRLSLLGDVRDSVLSERFGFGRSAAR